MSRPIELGPFLLLDPIGSGAMGTVYHAIHPDSGARVAVKVLRPEAAADELALDNLEGEVRAVALLDHPHIVRIYDVGKITPEEAERAPHALVVGTPWFAMEVAEHGSLQRRLRSLDGNDLFELLDHLLSALAHAHARGILHLDLKPANVMFGGRTQGALLTDFGMGVIGDPDPTGDFVRGTPHFMAPELVRGRWEELGPWTDLYALGNLAWVAATGHPAMPEGTAHDILAAQLTQMPRSFDPRMDLPEGFEPWVRRLLHKDPDRRFVCAADARKALMEVRALDPGPRIPEDWRVSELQSAAEVTETTGLGLAMLRQPPLVGRTRERSMMWQALREAEEGATWVVVIRGPAGSGKSRLGQWLGVRAHELGAAVQLATRHTAEGEGGMRAALRRMFPIDLRDWDAEPGLGTRLQERGLAPPIARDVAAWLARGVVEQVGGGQEGWWELAADALFAVRADRTPVVLVDDVHHGVDTLRFVRWMLTNRRLVPGVYVLVAEDESLMDLPESEELLQQIEAMEGVVTLELGPLSEQARTALARRVLPLEPSLAAELAERTDGSPGYTVEMLHDLAERGVLERGPRGLRLREGEQLSSPQQLSSMWEDHLARVLDGHPEWREPLEVAAVLGTQVDTELWREACRRLGREAPFELLDALVEARLARPMTNAIRFTHPMMCDAIAEEVTDSDVFRACAEVLTGVDDARAGAAWAQAGDLQRALDGWMRQAERFRRGQPGRLETLVTRIRDAADEILASDDPRWTEVYDLQVRLALDRGRSSDALAAASRLWEVADDDRSQLLAHLAMSRASLDLLDHRGALRHVRAAGELVERGVVSDRPTLAVELVGVAITLGLLADAERWLAECRSTPSTDLEQARLALAHGQAAAAADRTRWLGTKATGDRSLRARAALCEGYARLSLGSHEEALTAFQAARRRFRALGLVTEAVASIGLAVTLDTLGHQDEALRVLDTLQAHALGPRLAWKVALGEVAVRVSRPQDVTFGLWWRKVRQGLEAALALDPVDALVLRHAVPRAARGDRATELSDALHRFR